MSPQVLYELHVDRNRQERRTTRQEPRQLEVSDDFPKPCTIMHVTTRLLYFFRMRTGYCRYCIYIDRAVPIPITIHAIPDHDIAMYLDSSGQDSTSSRSSVTRFVHHATTPKLVRDCRGRPLAVSRPFPSVFVLQGPRETRSDTLYLP